MNAAEPDRRRRRVRGAMMLAACGDALGAPYEGQSKVDAAALERDLEAPNRILHWTDDTAQMLVLARHLDNHDGGVHADALAGELAAMWAVEPRRGYGPGAVQVLSQILSGVPWARAAADVFGGAGSLGNGAAMRVAPVGLLPHLGFAEIAALARASASVTHAHPLAADGAAAQAVAVAAAARSDPTAPFDAPACVADVAEQVTAPEFIAALTAVPAALDGRASDIAAMWDRDGTALGSVPAALSVFLRHPDDPARAIAEAIELGGDTDTIAAMAGAMAGARCGEDAVPEEWAKRLEDAPRVRDLADSLAALALESSAMIHTGRPHVRPLRGNRLAADPHRRGQSPLAP